MLLFEEFSRYLVVRSQAAGDFLSTKFIVSPMATLNLEAWQQN
jgi:hypothetical protein